MNWVALGAIATCVLAGGISFAIWQIKETRRSNNAQVAVDLFRELRDTDAIIKLRSIYALKSDDFRRLSSQERNDIDYVLGRFEMLGALTLNKIIDKKLAIETYGGAPALKCWYKLYNYIRKVQDMRGYCFENYELFIGLCLEYFKEHNIWVKFYKDGEDNEGINLITELTNSKRPRGKEEIYEARGRDC